MDKIFKMIECTEVFKLIGNTPLIKLKNIHRKSSNIWLKLEYYNPTGSHKDRIALFMLCKALEQGVIRKGDIVVEASTGNTGISIAYIASLLGLKPVIVVPADISPEKKKLIKIMGGEIIEIKEKVDPAIYRRKARELAEELGGYYVGQYDNPANPEAHYTTTGPEIWEQMKGGVDVFVMGVGTGGTITGVGRFLKEKDKSIRVVAVEPEGSVISKKLRGEEAVYRPHIIEGLTGYDIPANLDTSIVDEYVMVSEVDAIKTCYKLLRYEGIFAGPSTGANIYAALRIAEEVEENVNIVTIAADTGYKYLSTIYNEKWLEKKFGLDIKSLLS